MKAASGHGVTSANLRVGGIQSVEINLGEHGFDQRPYHFLASVSVPNAEHTGDNSTDAFQIKHTKNGLLVTISAANSSAPSPEFDSGSEFDWLAIQE